MAEIVVYGATGLVGGRVCAELDDAGVPFAVAGRDRAALVKLADVVGADDVRVAETEDIARVLAGVRVVVNCAGPHEAVLAAALAAHVHYVDVGGAQRFLHEVYERYESAARHAEVACVPSCGVACALGDWASAWAAQHVCELPDDGDAVRTATVPRLAEDRPLDEILVSYVFDDLVLSPGSQRAVFDNLHDRGLVWRRDRWESVAPGAEKRTINVGPQLGGHRNVVSFPGGDVITIPRHIAANAVKTFFSTTRSPLAMTALRWLARAMPLVPRAATQALATYTPSDDDYAQSQFAVVAQARRGFNAAQVVVRGVDQYRASAVIAAWVARALLARTRGPTGMRAPSELFRPAPALAAVAASAQLVVEPSFA